MYTHIYTPPLFFRDLLFSIFKPKQLFFLQYAGVRVFFTILPPLSSPSISLIKIHKTCKSVAVRPATLSIVWGEEEDTFYSLSTHGSINYVLFSFAAGVLTFTRVCLFYFISFQLLPSLLFCSLPSSLPLPTFPFPLFLSPPLFPRKTNNLF